MMTSEPWPTVPLTKICKIGAGNTAPTDDEHFAGGEFPFVRMQDIGRCDGVYLGETVDQVNELAVKDKRLKLWPAESLLIPKSGASILLNHRALLRVPSYVVSHLAILVPGPLVDSKFLYWAVSAIDMRRYVYDIGYPSLNLSDVEQVKIPLPPLSEQRRIVEIMKEAEAVRRLRADAASKIVDLVPAIFRHCFHDTQNMELFRPVGELVEEFRYGTSRKSGESGLTTLRIPNIIGSRISYDDIVRVEMDDREADRLKLLAGDVLFVRTNGNPRYVGRCGVFDPEDARKQLSSAETVVYASYLIRARIRSDLIRPRFLQAYLSTEAGRAAILRNARTAAGQYNINIDGLASICIPVPPLDHQDEFLRLADESQRMEAQYDLAFSGESELQASLLSSVFIGDITADWRRRRASELQKEAEDRDYALKEKGVSVTQPEAPEPSGAIVEDTRLAALTPQQRMLVQDLQELWRDNEQQTFTPDSISMVSSDPTLRHNPDLIRRHLDVLAARGYILRLSHPEKTKSAHREAFAVLYRRVRCPADAVDPSSSSSTETEVDEVRSDALNRTASRLKEYSS